MYIFHSRILSYLKTKELHQNANLSLALLFLPLIYTGVNTNMGIFPVAVAQWAFEDVVSTAFTQ